MPLCLTCPVFDHSYQHRSLDKTRQKGGIDFPSSHSMNKQRGQNIEPNLGFPIQKMRVPRSTIEMPDQLTPWWKPLTNLASNQSSSTRWWDGQMELSPRLSWQLCKYTFLFMVNDWSMYHLSNTLWSGRPFATFAANGIKRRRCFTHKILICDKNDIYLLVLGRE